MTHRDFTRRRVSLLTALVVALIAAAMALIVPAQADTAITVTTTGGVVASGGLCSLREAIIAANTDAAFNGCPAGSGADTVVFSPVCHSRPCPFIVARGAVPTALAQGPSGGRMGGVGIVSCHNLRECLMGVCANQSTRPLARKGSWQRGGFGSSRALSFCCTSFLR